MLSLMTHLAPNKSVLAAPGCCREHCSTATLKSLLLKWSLEPEISSSEKEEEEEEDSDNDPEGLVSLWQADRRAAQA